MNRRDFVRAAGAALPLAGCAPAALAPAEAQTPAPPLETAGPVMAGPLRAPSFRHSVCRWPFGDWPLEQLCETAADLGIASVELVQPADAPVLARYGLTCAMTAHPDAAVDALRKGWNRAAHHEWLVPAYRRQLAATADAGWPNLIVFSGNRDGLDDAAGLETMAQGIEQILPDAERLGVTLCIELFNSKVDHPDYQADSTAWGLALVERLGSSRFKILYDIYHMQIMEGDVIRTVTDHLDAIAHIHTAGVPGRHEIDESQELFYPAIMRALDAAGFDGFVAQEFIPTGDPRAALADAIARCTV
ncbi:hydroxypyruvate isomerase family protein [Rubrivirga sp. IMCC45206]|uniref:hydroxypyruvate isomerase family protein n=1 Tax=Rubrivirga sp. IMCC45206 TaxID=3391614 RepID=UPI0039902532